MSSKNGINSRLKGLNLATHSRGKKIWLAAIIFPVLLIGVLSLPPVWSRVTYHYHELYRTVKYWLKPPSEAVFVPSSNKNGITATFLPAPSATITPTLQSTAELATTELISVTALSTPLATDTPPPLPTLTPAPLPESVLLTGFHPERQFMNNCGPATLSVYLSYYDWGKDQLATGGVLRPNDKDVNVMPYELVDFVNKHTDLHAIWRYGGDLQMIKVLLNAGFPVMIEKSFEPYSLRNEGWMGHYNLAVGYDDERQTLTVHDSYFMSYPPWGGEIPVETWDTFIGFDFYYTELEEAWRSFNNVFIVVFPPEKEQEVLSLLGPRADDKQACQIAYDHAMQETTSLTAVRDQYFAWFNAGTSLVCLQDYSTAVTAFDTAFSIYPNIPQNSRPYRILWYETGPYEAYYNTGRYQDVINLASQTLGNMADPVIEESYYWRALSYNALGNTAKAIADLRSSLEYHPGFAPSVELLKQLGKTP